MAMIDIVIPEGDPQQGTLEIGAGTSNSANDVLSDTTGIEELSQIVSTTGYGGG